MPHKNLIAFTDLVGAHRPHASPRQWPLLLPCLQDQWAEGRAHHHGALHELCHERHPAHRPAPRPLDPQGRGPPLFSRRLIKGLMLIDAEALLGIFFMISSYFKIKILAGRPLRRTMGLKGFSKSYLKSFFFMNIQK